MVNETFEEVSAILKHIMENPSVPRNIRRAADESFQTSNDPNIPVHARTLIWEILSKLEAITV